MFVKFNLEKIMIKDYLDNTLEIRNKSTKFVDASSRRKCRVERERETKGTENNSIHHAARRYYY